MSLQQSIINQNIHAAIFTMKKKFNLVLIPANKSEKFASVSKYLINIADSYVHGKHSLPHVTLYQFYADEDAIGRIWQQACAHVTPKTLQLTFATYSCKTFNNEIFWISLIPNHADILQSMHHAVANVIQQPAKENYDPHLTLVNTKIINADNAASVFPTDYHPITDDFILALGESDETGQLLNVLYQSL